MALHSKWEDGNLIFYDGVLDNFRIRGSTGALVFGCTGVGCLAKDYYAGSTANVGITVDATGEPLAWNIVGGIITGCSTV